MKTRFAGEWSSRAICAVAVVVAACSANPSPVPIIGATAEVSALEGEWVGEYRSPEAGRSGSISFKLEAGRDTAFGDVLMIPGGQETAASGRTTTDAMRSAPRALMIRFVRVSGNAISGRIDPYQSPDCGCMLFTTFEGTIEGNRISGELLIRHSEQNAPPQRGTWWAERGMTP